MTRKFILYILIALMAAAVGAYAGIQRTQPGTPQGQALTQLMSQSMPDPQGHPQPLSKWQGKPLLVNFWATWCGPCVEEMPELVKLHKELPGLQVIGIGVDTAPNIVAFAAKLNIDYPLYVGDSSAIGTMRGLGNSVGGLPFSLLIGADGRIKHTYLGALDFVKLRKDIHADVLAKK